LGEELVLYKDLGGHFGLVDRHCVHRRADLSTGMVEAEGIRCHYHGWRFNAQGAFPFWVLQIEVSFRQIGFLEFIGDRAEEIYDI
jgi:hypothetical protein